MRRGRRRGNRACRGAGVGARRPRGAGPRARLDDRVRNFVAQQRGHPQRDLLSEGQLEGDDLRRGPPAALPLLPRVWDRPCADRQDHRRLGRGGASGARQDRRGGVRQRRRRPRTARRRQGAAARAGITLCCGIVVAVDRDHRQPCADARLPGRRRGRGRDDCAAHPDRFRAGACRWLRVDNRRRRARRPPLPASGQCRGALRAGPGPRHRRGPARNDPAGLFLPRRLFHLERQDTLPASGVPGAAGGRARRPHHARSFRAGPLRPRCRMDFLGRLHGGPSTRRGFLCRRPPVLAGLARRRPAAGLCRRAPQDHRADGAGGRFRRARTRRPTACRDLSISTGSSCRG